MSERHDLIRELLATDDPDLVRLPQAERLTGIDYGDILEAIFAGQVLGGPDREWMPRVSLSGLRALQARQREAAARG